MKAPKQRVRLERKQFGSTIGGIVQNYNAGSLTDMDDELDLTSPGRNFGSKFVRRPCKNYKVA